VRERERERERERVVPWCVCLCVCVGCYMMCQIFVIEKKSFQNVQSKEGVLFVIFVQTRLLVVRLL
jgi:hypothetical protein